MNAMTNKKRVTTLFFITITPCIVFLQAQEREVVINVVAPRSTPPDAQLFIAGNQALLGEWDAGKIQMKRESDSLWSFSSRMPTNSYLEFKITRGSWSTEALYEMGAIPENTKLNVVNDTLMILYPVGWKDFGFRFEGGITGTVRYHRGLHTDSLPNPRDVIVWLPPSYEKDKSERYPVLYMHDGQNIVDPSTSFSGFDWRVDEIADSLIKKGRIEEIIIVGIYNTKDRVPEYSDTKEGKAYADFVVHTLKPLIDSAYRTKSGREHTAVMGSSMGGLISFLLAWWYPEVFSNAGCLSSAFLVDSNKIMRDMKEYTGQKKKIRIYLDDGGVGLEARLKPGYDEMIMLLKQKGYVAGKDLEYFYDEGAEHSEKAWARRVWRPLVFMFGK
jgi:predicted alpha/beta superfamily hydrolase